MDEYKEPAAAVMGLPLDTDEDEVDAKLFDRFGVDLFTWEEIVDGLLPFTPQFPSLLIPGEMIQAFSVWDGGMFYIIHADLHQQVHQGCLFFTKDLLTDGESFGT